MSALMSGKSYTQTPHMDASAWLQHLSVSNGAVEDTKEVKGDRGHQEEVPAVRGQVQHNGSSHAGRVGHVDLQARLGEEVHGLAHMSEDHIQLESSVHQDGGHVGPPRGLSGQASSD
eukprot:10401084-Heterocapsa_arctica.AAC.1